MYNIHKYCPKLHLYESEMSEKYKVRMEEGAVGTKV